MSYLHHHTERTQAELKHTIGVCRSLISSFVHHGANSDMRVGSYFQNDEYVADKGLYKYRKQEPFSETDLFCIAMIGLFHAAESDQYSYDKSVSGGIKDRCD